MSEDIAEICTILQQESLNQIEDCNLEDDSAGMVKRENSTLSFRKSFLGKKK